MQIHKDPKPKHCYDYSQAPTVRYISFSKRAATIFFPGLVSGTGAHIWTCWDPTEKEDNALCEQLMQSVQVLAIYEPAHGNLAAWRHI